ncbi:MAG: thiamine phosphate synthase, partial [Pseudomonadota bacterium]
MTEPTLYLITPQVLDDLDAFASDLSAVFDAVADTNAAVACVQLRLKGSADDDILRAAEKLLPLCQAAEAG